MSAPPPPAAARRRVRPLLVLGLAAAGVALLRAKLLDAGERRFRARYG